MMDHSLDMKLPCRITAILAHQSGSWTVLAGGRICPCTVEHFFEHYKVVTTFFQNSKVKLKPFFNGPEEDYWTIMRAQVLQNLHLDVYHTQRIWKVWRVNFQIHELLLSSGHLGNCMEPILQMCFETISLVLLWSSWAIKCREFPARALSLEVLTFIKSK